MTMKIIEWDEITDWDVAYANGAYIPNSDKWPEAWITPAADFRVTAKMDTDIVYGPHDRNKYDLFYPSAKSVGLFVFIHGGYWKALDKTYWSHLAQGAVSAGWTVAMPSYVLCPEVSIENIVEMITNAITHAADKVDGPIILSGHSAGGHLVASMLCEGSKLAHEYQQRIKHVVSISGVHDLRPLLNTEINTQLKLDKLSATAISPALLQPIDNCRLTAWVGGDERPEFIRQSELISSVWHGLGAQTRCVIEPDKHHFDVIDSLMDADSPLMRTILDC